MSPYLADHLTAARRRLFVGRDAERVLFQSALNAPELPFHVLHIFGPGGVGKTMLLQEYLRISNQAQAPAIYFDARNVEPMVESFVSALRLAMALPAPKSPAEVLASWSGRHVLLIDTYETLMPLDGWLRDVFLPQLSEDALVVLAGRNPPSPGWRKDPGWQMLIRILPLRNLSPTESRTYLNLRQIPPDQHEAVLDFTHGHPLALSLVADVFAQRPNTHFEPAGAPDVIKTLLEEFVQKAPGPAHRAALEACALVRLTTEPLLADMLGMADPPPNLGDSVHELFEWLRGLSFIEAGPFGLSPHDLAHEVLAADLRWRNPGWYADLHRRARTHYSRRLEQTHGQEQQQVLFNYIYLHRDNPVVRPFFEWQQSSGLLTDTFSDEDKAPLLAIVARHEGEASARLATYWFTRKPQDVLVIRDSAGLPAGFLTMNPLHQVDPEDLEVDPGVRAAWRYLEAHAPLRAGEGGTLFRFWMARETYQSISPVQSLLFINMVQHYLTTPGLAFTLLPCADPDFWAPVFDYADLVRIPEADFEVSGRHYGVYGHDWRAVPPAAWLALLAEREIATVHDVVPLPRREPLIVLSKSEFAVALRDALRGFAQQPERLHSSPLLWSKMVNESAGGSRSEEERIRVLRALVLEAVELLQVSQRHIKLYRAVYHTYLQPAPTQEKAAELIDVPFGTYRRHLKAGIIQVTETLWRREIGETEI